MTSLLLIGCGNMGSALVARWSEKQAANLSSITVVEPNEVTLPKHVSKAKQISELVEKNPCVVVLAVKPQQMDTLLPELKKHLTGSPVYLSVAAGKTIGFYESHLGQRAKIVRAMPNTPALIGEGMSALVANNNLEASEKTLVTQLMATVGDTIWLEDETLMDAVTAVSGSGPAYYYYMTECLTQAGIAQGLSPEQAAQLAVATFIGAAKLAGHRELPMEELRRQVTSPGGTTAAAISMFEKNAELKALVENAVAAAVARAKQL